MYYALGYPDLAAADAFVTFTLCETLADEDVSDLRPTDEDGVTPWPTSNNEGAALQTKVSALALLSRTLCDLGCYEDAKLHYSLLQHAFEHQYMGQGSEDVDATLEKMLNEFFSLFESRQPWSLKLVSEQPIHYGMCPRHVYPWNEYERDRYSRESIAEINQMLSKVAPDLQAGVVDLPALNGPGSKPTNDDNTSRQFGLFAKKNLPAGATILKEKSVLTGIRPRDGSLCDACAADISRLDPVKDLKQCSGPDCDLTFCSAECADLAAAKYHRSHTEELEPENRNQEFDDRDSENRETEHARSDRENAVDDGVPSPLAPFCGEAFVHEIGRAETSESPEWDLYFLLFTRAMAMAETQVIHPLAMQETKYLWGDFEETPGVTNLPVEPFENMLPFSFRHHIEQPLQWFEEFMHSRKDSMPYSKKWLERYDWWIVQTLFAKFRGVANAELSTFDGKPESAAVHPMWCLANHSCNPNILWTSSGVRTMMVRQAKVWHNPHDSDDPTGNAANTIRAGEQIWSHYTDVDLDFQQRRDNLAAVLGGVCMCERCIAEEKEQRE